MSTGSCRKWLSCLGISAFLWLATPSLSRAQYGGAPGATFGTPCAVGCQTHHCPPAYKHIFEGAPRIHFHRGCPHPICNPCDLPHWGFYETCWSPWPFPPTWGHCPVPPPASFVHLNPYPVTPLPPIRSTYPGNPGIAPAPAYPTPNGGYEEQLPQLPTPRSNSGR